MATKNSVTWWEVKTFVPIITSAIIIALSYAALGTKVTVLETKMDTMIEQNKQILATYSGVETRYGQMAVKVAQLEERIK